MIDIDANLKIDQKQLELELLLEQRSSIRGSRSMTHPTSRFFGYLMCADGHEHIFKSGIGDDDLLVLKGVAKACMGSISSSASVRRNVKTKRLPKHHIPEAITPSASSEQY
jgi:hypothetical protein